MKYNYALAAALAAVSAAAVGSPVLNPPVDYLPYIANLNGAWGSGRRSHRRHATSKARGKFRRATGPGSYSERDIVIGESLDAEAADPSLILGRCGHGHRTAFDNLRR